MLVWPLVLKSNIFSFTRWTKTYFYLRLTFYTVTHKIEFADSLIVFFDENALLFAQHERRICILNHVFYFSVWRITSNVIFLFPFQLLKRFVVYKCKCVNFMHPCNCCQHLPPSCEQDHLHDWKKFANINVA